MFVIFCKDTGCVKATFTENPIPVFIFEPDWQTHYELQEFPLNEMVALTQRVLKVENGKLIDLGNYADLEKTGMPVICDDCPPLFG